jgi:hypothetical protein
MLLLHRFIGAVVIKTNLSIEELGSLLSTKILGGLALGGKELEIHEEIPCIFLAENVLGFRIELDGNPGFKEETFYSFQVSNIGFPSAAEAKEQLTDISLYMYFLIKDAFLGRTDIVVIRPEKNRN